MKINTSSIKKSISKGLENKYVLYFVLFLAITNLLGYALLGDLRVMLFFGLVAYIASRFTKNMIIILGSAMILTNFFLSSKLIISVGESSNEKNGNNGKEGMTNRKKSKPKRKEKLTNLTPAKFDDDEDTEERVDYAKTVEQAYDNLDNMLGSGGIQKLTKDTSKLMDKQNKLIENLKGMGPLISQYKEMMGNMDMGNINNLVAQLTGNKKLD